jgi:hypothetical protein
MADVGGGSEYVPLSANNPDAATAINEALIPPEDCRNPSDVWRVAMEQGITIPSDLEAATKTFKTDLQAEYMLNGKKDNIHDENIIIVYTDLLGKIGDALQNHILQGTPVTVDDKIQGIVDTYVAALKAEQIQQNLLLEYIRLHFHCFKGCFETKCLSFE